MPHVTLPSLLSSSPNPRLRFIDRPVVVVLIDSGGNADQICLGLSGLAWMFFSLSSCPHCSVRFQECLQCLLRGNEELVMVRGSQELIFLSFPFLPLSPSLFFFSFTLCLVCLGLDLDRNSAVQLKMSWICWQVGALLRSRAHSLCAVFTPNGRLWSIRFHILILKEDKE